MRGPSGLGASRAEEKGASCLARAGVLDSTLSPASKRNEVLVLVSRASTVGVVRHAGWTPGSPRTRTTDSGASKRSVRAEKPIGINGPIDEQAPAICRVFRAGLTSNFVFVTPRIPESRPCST